MELIGTHIAGRFTIREKIMEGGMSVLYRAEDDREPGLHVAVKVLRPNTVSRRIENVIRFRTEATIISKISDPRVVRVYAIGEIAERHYIVMEHLSGKPLSNLLAGKPLETDRALQIAVQIARALEAVHHRGILHRDLTPGNIMICGDRTVLIDFGLAQIKEYPEMELPGELTGTLPYVSPEQTGLLRRHVDERSDLYSLGIILYQMLTGSLPFSGDDISTIIHQHVAAVPAPPSEKNLAVPVMAERIVLKLLEKEPDNRYRSAAGLAHDLEKCRNTQDEFVLGLRDRGANLAFRTRIIGRDRELSVMKKMWESARRGAGGFCLLFGDAGQGKSRLAEEIRDHVTGSSGLFISGTSSSQPNKIPYGPLREAVDMYLRRFAAYPPDRRDTIKKRLSEDLGDRARILHDLSPLIREIASGGPVVTLKPDREHRRFINTAARFLTGLAEIEGGLAVFLDDLQWADEGTLEILAEAAVMAEKSRLLILGAYRSDELAPGHSLEETIDHANSAGTPPVRLHLSNFNRDNMLRFVGGLLNEPSDRVGEISDFVLAKSGGNPYMASDIVKQLVVEQVIRYENDSWTLDKRALDEIELSSSIVDTIFTRISLLDDREKSVLSCAAVIGKRFDTESLFRLSDLSPDEVISVIDRAARLHILEYDPEDRSCVGFIHDRIREAFESGLSVEERRTAHRRIATVIEGICGDDPGERIFDLAYHSIEAADRDRILRYAFPAGLAARKRYAHEEALRYFMPIGELACGAGISPDDPLAFLWNKVLRERGEINLIIGRYDESLADFETLLGIVHDDTERIYLYRQISYVYFKSGNWKSCEEYGRMGLALLGERLPSGRAGIILGIVRELSARAILNALSVLGRRPDPPSEKHRTIISFMVALAWSFILSDIPKYVYSILRGLNMAVRKIGPSEELGMMLSAYASIGAALSFFKSSLANHRVALSVRLSSGNPWGVAQSYQLLAFTLDWMGEYRESLSCFRESVSLFTTVGDLREIGMSVAGIIHNYAFLADYRELGQAIDRYRDIAVRSKDAYAMSEADTYAASYHLETGDIDRAESLANSAYEWSLSKQVLFTHCRACIELGRIYLEKGEPAKATTFLQRARELYEGHDFLDQYTILLYSYLAEATLSCIPLCTGRKEKARLTSRARRYSRAALRHGRRLPSHLGAALGARARYLAHRGKNRAADRAFREAIETHRRLGQRYLLARALFARGIFLSATGRADSARTSFEEAYAASRTIGAHRLAERTGNLLGVQDRPGPSGAIESAIEKERMTLAVKLAAEVSDASDTDELLYRALSRSMQITGAMRGSFIVRNRKGLPRVIISLCGAKREPFEFSSGLVDMVFTSGEPHITTDAETDQRFHLFRSVSLYDLKSIMVVPVTIRGRIIGICYLDNPLASGIFTEHEERLVTGYLTQIAYAVENVQLQRIIETRGLDEEKPAGISPVSEEKLKAAIAYLKENYTSDISREGLAASIGVHPDHLGKLFKAYTGKRLSEYINDLRIEEAMKRLAGSDDTILDIAFSVGFESLRTFNRAFLKYKKVTPTAFRESSWKKE